MSMIGLAHPPTPGGYGGHSWTCPSLPAVALGERGGGGSRFFPSIRTSDLPVPMDSNAISSWSGEFLPKARPVRRSYGLRGRRRMVLSHGQRRHARIVGRNAAVNVPVYRREVGRRGAGVQRHLVGQLFAVATWPAVVSERRRLLAGEVVKELPPTLRLRRTRRCRPCPRPGSRLPAVVWRRRVVQACPA